MVFMYLLHKQLPPNAALSVCSGYTTVSVIAFSI